LYKAAAVGILKTLLMRRAADKQQPACAKWVPGAFYELERKA